MLTMCCCYAAVDDYVLSDEEIVFSSDEDADENSSRSKKKAKSDDDEDFVMSESSVSEDAEEPSSESDWEAEVRRSTDSEQVMWSQQATCCTSTRRPVSFASYCSENELGLKSVNYSVLHCFFTKSVQF